MIQAPSKVVSVGVIASAQVLALALWFSVTAVAPDLARQAALTPGRIALLALSVQLGFVCGGLVSAVTGLADRLDPRRLFTVGALTGAIANALFLALDPHGVAAILSRFMVGASLACVYPVGMKMAAGWATRGDAGLLVGIVVGALTLGSAAPSGFAWAGGVDWRSGVVAASICALAAAALINRARLGPQHGASRRIDYRGAADLIRDPGVRLVTLGYLGHMWELYAGWTWIGALAASSYALRMSAAQASSWSKLTAFSVIAVGAPACVIAGFAADRLGRTTITMAALALSGLCCLGFGLIYGLSPWLLIALGLVWGAAVIADSAQFSASVAELARPERIGVLLTLQTALGFLLTAASIRLLPIWAEQIGWRWSFAPLAIGPLIGLAAMARLRGSAQSARLAGGRG